MPVIEIGFDLCASGPPPGALLAKCNNVVCDAARKYPSDGPRFTIGLMGDEFAFHWLRHREICERFSGGKIPVLDTGKLFYFGDIAWLRPRNVAQRQAVVADAERYVSTSTYRASREGSDCIRALLALVKVDGIAAAGLECANLRPERVNFYITQPSGDTGLLLAASGHVGV